jgi:hypothetical protein
MESLLEQDDDCGFGFTFSPGEGAEGFAAPDLRPGLLWYDDQAGMVCTAACNRRTAC